MTEANFNESDKAIAKALDGNSGQESKEIHLSTGVILLAKQANPNVLIRIMTAVPRPKPPVWKHPDFGREMENLEHPDYIKQVQAWEMQYNNGMLNALVGLGTTLKEKPKKMPGPDDKSWLDDYRIFGLPTMEDSKAWRYVTWVLFLAAPLDTDTKMIGEKVKQLSGVKEADVQNAENFSEGNEK